jgi:aryl-alcohol dehydrogenase-like predicted oxidoreductase
MRYRTLPGTDIEVSVICCGAMAMSNAGTYGEQDDQQSIDTVHAAIEAGINFFDTAEGYGDGHSEEVLGRALESRRDDVVLASKVSPGNLASEDLESSLDASLERLRTDYLDLYQVHWPNHDIPFDRTASVLERMRMDGKMRYWGVSNFGKVDIQAAVSAAGHPVVNQVPYSLLWRVIEHDIVPLCAENEVGILCYSPLAQGILTGKFDSADDIPAGRKRPRYCQEGRTKLAFRVVDELQAVAAELNQPMADVALAWLVGRQGVTSVIAGMRTPGQAEQNARAGDLELPEDAAARLTRASDPLFNDLDDNPDMWREDSRYR